MEITSKSQAISIDTYVKQVQAQPKTEPVSEKEAQSQGLQTDTVVISDAAKRVQEAQKQIQAIPDVRADRVAELRNQIENGTYEIKADQIAGKMIKESLMHDLFK
ncbi:MAG: flagellar biosynthesis anti-sigma factor FlgM [Deltaproteobacteria bacterium]|nr:flagellar biosynthesis anti-sigma factor FlgM [Deltaproteobacteria bacterium]